LGRPAVPSQAGHVLLTGQRLARPGVICQFVWAGPKVISLVVDGCHSNLLLLSRRALAAAQTIHGSKLTLVRSIFVFTADARPSYYAAVAAPIRLRSLFLVPVPLRRRLGPFPSPSPFPRFGRPRPLPALRRRHHCRLRGSRAPPFTGFASRSFSPP